MEVVTRTARARVTGGIVRSELIRAARERAGLTQRQLAEALGVTPAQVSHWENGLRSIDVKLLERIANLTFSDFSEMIGTPTENATLERPDEIELVRTYRRLSERQQKNLLDLLRVSLNVRRDIEQQTQPA